MFIFKQTVTVTQPVLLSRSRSVCSVEHVPPLSKQSRLAVRSGGRWFCDWLNKDSVSVSVSVRVSVSKVVLTMTQINQASLTITVTLGLLSRTCVWSNKYSFKQYSLRPISIKKSNSVSVFVTVSRSARSLEHLSQQKVTFTHCNPNY